MEVIFKEGMLYLQGFKFGKRTWRKIWIMLFKPSSTGVGRLEFFNILYASDVPDQKKAVRLKTSERKVVRLSDCLSVTPAPKESCPPGYTAFYLNTTQSTYTLASMTSQDWISALCLIAFQKDPGESDKGVLERGNVLSMEDNELYSSWKTDVTVPAKCYKVTVQSTEASRRCKLAGEYLVSLVQGSVTLLAIDTGHIIYRWPHRLLRKFGQVEGGFSIEAGRRCESGEGVFIFLSSQGHHIFQAILEQCSLERTSPVQTPSVKRRSLCDPSLGILPTGLVSNQATSLTVYSSADALEDTEDTHYSTINEAHAAHLTRLDFVKPQLSNSKEAVGAEDEDEDEDERCQSLEALKLDDDAEENIYCNLSRATPPPAPNGRLKGESDGSECVYADVAIYSKLQRLSPLVPQQPAQAQSGPCSSSKPRYQRQPLVSNYIQAGCDSQTQPVDDTQEMEEAISSSSLVAPTEVPGSFKHRLAEIFSKDLAKFQPVPAPGPGSPEFPQY